MKKQLIIFFAAIFFTGSLYSQIRVERPIQVQLNFSGIFLKTFSNSLTNSEVNHLEVTDWALPGISVGYHFKKLLYLGYSYTPSRGMVLEEEWGFSNENDGYIIVKYETGKLHNIELRVSPFEMGFYAQVFYNHIPKVNYTMNYQLKSETVLIGENEYDTDLWVTWNFKAVNALGIGFGYNWILKNGISINLGLALPIIKDPYYENIEIISTQEPPVDISTRDLKFAGLSIANETFYYPVQLYLNIGYNFNKIEKKSSNADRF